jgi:hypothetical protein
MKSTLQEELDKLDVALAGRGGYDHGSLHRRRP